MVFKKGKKPKQPDLKQVFDYACWLLARRSYSQAELLEKFHKRFIPEEEIFFAALKKLVKLGLQSDENFTESFVSLHDGWGRRRLELELKKKGIAEELIEKFLPDNSAELERCKEALKIKLKNSPVPEDYRARQKILAFLARRGFGLDVIKVALRP